MWTRLAKVGAREGDTVFVGEHEFEWKEAIIAGGTSARKTRRERMEGEAPLDSSAGEWEELTAEQESRRRGTLVGEAALY